MGRQTRHRLDEFELQEGRSVDKERMRQQKVKPEWCPRSRLKHNDRATNTRTINEHGERGRSVIFNYG